MGLLKLPNRSIIKLLNYSNIKNHQIEEAIGDCNRAVRLRRTLISQDLRRPDLFKGLSYKNYDYNNVHKVCCENVVGYTQVPVGIVGPLLVNGNIYRVPMATTEGSLVSSTNRGCKAIALSGGVQVFITRDAMTRAPVVSMRSMAAAIDLCRWIKDHKNFSKLASTFNETSRFARLKTISGTIVGRDVYLRFTCDTGDAMGMNMVTRGVESVLKRILQIRFPSMEILSLSGNVCTDKKPSAINWLEGRGKSVCASATISSDVVSSMLKTDVDKLIRLNIKKNLVGSAVAGSIGGFNAHAANIVAAIFLATGQDIAQVVESSNCLTTMETSENGTDLQISVTMPSIEVGTVGGGTHLPSQAACLDLLGVKGTGNPVGDNSKRLAKIVAATVLAGELSLMSSLSSGSLMGPRGHTM